MQPSLRSAAQPEWALRELVRLKVMSSFVVFPEERAGGCRVGDQPSRGAGE